MSGATKLQKPLKEDHLTSQQDLERRFAKNISVPELAAEITRLLKLLGKKPGTFENVGQYLAEKLAPRFACKSDDLARLIKYRPKELGNLVNQATDLASKAKWEEIKANVLPMIAAQKKVRRKIKTQEERARRTKQAKNRYEHLERRCISKPGAIEREFSARSALLSLYPEPVTGPCLDEIFDGGTIQMCNGTCSLQSLFGLRRKKLTAAGKGSRRSRGIFYDWRAVLRCMVALLKQTGPTAPWLPDPTRRRTVLAGILVRARQKATPAISEAFAKALDPYLN